MRAVAVSGWGQPADALAAVAPDAAFVNFADLDARFTLDAIAEAGKDCELAIGWSLGGQLLVRAIAAGMMRPKKLVLVATSFQFVASPLLPPPASGGSKNIGMPRDTFRMFRDNYAENPERTLRKAWDLIAYGDTREAEVKKHLAREDMKKALAGNWLAWLDDLERFSCEGLVLDDFPPTLLIHGDRDAVVRYEQSERFLERLPQARLVTFSGCGHAPHWHDAKRAKEEIKNHV